VHAPNQSNRSMRDGGLAIAVVDEPGAGGASHFYDITGFDTKRNPANRPETGYVNFDRLVIIFQNGPVLECGVNGVTDEALLAIQIDRLRSFQSGKFACRENAIALTHLEEAMM
jgi:hypothetical protein